jgi:hypothetical protein
MAALLLPPLLIDLHFARPSAAALLARTSSDGASRLASSRLCSGIHQRFVDMYQFNLFNQVGNGTEIILIVQISTIVIHFPLTSGSRPDVATGRGNDT